MNTPHDDFDERAREAGRALRQPAPADGLTRINRARRNRRIAQVGGGLAVAAIAAGAVVLLVNRGDDETIVTTDPTTVPTTVPVDTTVPITDPAVAPTTVPPTVPGTTAAPEPGGLVPTVWVGQKLAGWYDGDVFVPFEFGGEPPDGLVGAEVELVDVNGATHRATVVTHENCSSPYLEPASEVWTLLSSAAAPVNGVPFEPSANPADLDAALSAAGASPASSRSVAVPGDDDLLLALADGWNDTFQYPTWIATWDGSELTTIEGDPDPSNALDIGNPVDAFYDLDGDGAWEIVFGVGDGWGVFELGTGDTLVFGAGHRCPAELPGAPDTPAGLVGDYSLEPGGASAALIVNDGFDTYVRYSFCQDTLVGTDGVFSVVSSSGACLGDEADPRLTGLAAASVSIDGTDVLRVSPPSGDTFDLHRMPLGTGLDLFQGSLAGVRAGEIGPVDELVARLGAELGEPDLDTGWFTTPANPNPDEPDCLAGMDTRTLWWGDLAVSFWPRDEFGFPGEGELWDFTLGAEPDQVRLPTGMSYSPVPNGLVSNDGIGIGSAASVFGYANWSDDVDGTQWLLLDERPPHYIGNYVTARRAGDTITQISATRTFC